jgi:hypothetical protein
VTIVLPPPGMAPAGLTPVEVRAILPPPPGAAARALAPEVTFGQNGGGGG